MYVPGPRARVAVVVAVVVAIATWQRARAVERLQPDYDEMPYLDLGYRYAERMAPGRWSEIPSVRENHEHPPMVKLAYGAAVKLTGAPEPDLDHIEVPDPMPEAARPAFRAARWTSAVPGIAQVATGRSARGVHPPGLSAATRSSAARATSPGGRGALLRVRSCGWVIRVLRRASTPRYAERGAM